MHPVDAPLPRQPGFPAAGLAAAVIAFLAGADMAALATVQPQIVNHLVSGIDTYAWSFFLFMGAFIIAMPVWGMALNGMGRAGIGLIGALVYVGGSVLTTIAWQFVMIVGCRVLQGIGLGAMMPTLFSLALEQDPQSARIVPWASLLGGIAGGPLAWWLVRDGAWPALFWADAALGALITLLIVLVLILRPGSKDRHVIAHQVVDQLDLAEPPVFNLFAMPATLTLSGLLAFQPAPDGTESPVALPRGRHFGIAAGISTLMGATTVTLMVFGPVHLQGSAGLPLWTTAAAMTLIGFFTPLGMTIGERLHRIVGVTGLARLGTALAAIATAVFAATRPLTPDARGWLVWMALFGLGMGLAHRGLLAYVRECLHAKRRGPGMGLLMAFRSVGGPFGTGIVGALLAAVLATTLLPLEKANRLLGPQHGADLLPRLREGLLPLLQTATAVTQWTIAALAVLTALLALLWRPQPD